MQAVAHLRQIEHLPACELRVRQPCQVCHAEPLGARAEQDVDAVHVDDVEGRAADGSQHGLRVERLADALVEGRQRSRLLVVEALGLEMARALDRDADLAAHRLEEAELGIVEALAGQGGHVEDSAARPVEGERNARVRHRLLESIGDRRHAGALAAVQRLPALASGEHPSAEALPEPPGAREPEVLTRDAAGGCQAQALVLLVLEEDPGGLQTEAVEQSVERAVEDGLDVLLTVEPVRDVGQHRQLPLAAHDGLLERTDTLRGGRSPGS